MTGPRGGLVVVVGVGVGAGVVAVGLGVGGGAVCVGFGVGVGVGVVLGIVDLGVVTTTGGGTTGGGSAAGASVGPAPGPGSDGMVAAGGTSIVGIALSSLSELLRPRKARTVVRPPMRTNATRPMTSIGGPAARLAAARCGGGAG
jgi:hypothetical protein